MCENLMRYSLAAFGANVPTGEASSWPLWAALGVAAVLIVVCIALMCKGRKKGKHDR
ncbi:MAG: hypothetical protein IJP03_03200 [Christensenellaceae bacterium]|nr:hypothetical protein [Christensenellaceae bacterium]